jgi:Asp/Glu/hydantoin racemase
MGAKLTLIHTVPPLLNVFNQLGAILLPGVTLSHILDEPILARIRQRGHLAGEDTARLLAHVEIAQQTGANAVLVTCSTTSPCVDDIRAKVSLPVFKIDEAMIARAVNLGSRIGVIATSATTIDPTRQMLQAQAETVGKKIQVESVMVANALPALLNGDGSTHDHLVGEATLKLMPRVDVVVLAQASMARVLDVISPAERIAPILSSPYLALEQVSALFAKEKNLRP